MPLFDDQIDIEMRVKDLTFSLKASLRSGMSVPCAVFLCFPFISLIFAYFTFGFVHQLQTAGNTIFLVMEKIFHICLDDTMTIYTILQRERARGREG